VAGEKSEQPTPQKLKKARQEGQIGRTQDIGAWVGMLAASIVLPRTLSSTMDHSRELMAKIPDVIADPVHVHLLHVGAPLVAADAAAADVARREPPG